MTYTRKYLLQRRYRFINPNFRDREILLRSKATSSPFRHTLHTYRYDIYTSIKKKLKKNG
jgi:hypothetical protein